MRTVTRHKKYRVLQLKTSFLLLCFLIAPASVYAQNSAMEACGFDISFPEEPTVVADTIQVGNVASVSWQLTAETNTASYSLMCQLVPEPPPAAMRAAILDNASASFGGTVVSEVEIARDGQPGVAFAIDMAATAPYVYNRTYVTDRAVIIISAGDLRSERGVQSAAITAFFDSFRVVD